MGLVAAGLLFSCDAYTRLWQLFRHAHVLSVLFIVLVQVSIRRMRSVIATHHDFAL